jgi:Skp family chaperone for outer membrane proteins
MTGMNRWYLPLALVVVALTTFVCTQMSVGQAGATWPNTRTATIDVVRIFNDFQQTKDLNDELNKRGEALKKEIADKRKILENKRAELEAFKQDSPDFNKRFQELMKQDLEFTVWGQYMQAQVEAEHRVWLKRTYQQIVDACKQIATERGIDVVMYSDAPAIEGESLEAMRDNIRLRKILWSSNQVDITDAVLQRLNKDYEKSGGRNSIKLPF